MNEEKAIDSYQNLGPDKILNAIESTGLVCDGRIFALNSYENRVYQIGIDESEPVIAKFYRPARRSDEAIKEEQQFTIQLAEHEIPVIGPVVDGKGETLHQYENFRFTLYPRRGGRPPELDEESSHRLWETWSSLADGEETGLLTPAQYLDIHRQTGLPMRAIWNQTQRWAQYGNLNGQTDQLAVRLGSNE